MTEPMKAPSLLSEFVYNDLLEKVINRTARVSVVGQGYVGLPLAIAFSRSGFNVNGLDVNAERVSRLRDYQANSPDVEDSELASLSISGRYNASADFSCITESDVVLICVPTPLRKSKDPDISYVIDVAETLASTLTPGKLIILESTTYPGTTEEVLLPLFEKDGLICGSDFFLAFSPERIDPGNKQYSVSEIPKVTGGVTAKCTSLAAALYRQIVDRVIEVSSPKVAELAKLYENVFRSVNIALANEFSIMCRQLDVCSREVIDAAASKPFGFMPFYPGPGIGGHCIPIDPAYLAWKMRFSNYQTRFIPLAEEINQSMPGHVVKLVNESLNRRKLCINGSRILALGIAYKAGIGDVREAPAIGILKTLIDNGAEISYVDPFVPSIDIAGIHFLSSNLTADLLENTDCVLILTDHPTFDYRTVIKSGTLVVDTRNATWGLPCAQNQVIRL